MKPELIAHRGYSAKYPENTLASIAAALQAGASYVEFDLQMMADNEFIVMHDSSLHRTAGVHQSVFALTSETVKKFHADYCDKFHDQFSSIEIPLLKDIVSLFKQFPETVAVIEIKTESTNEFGVEHVVNQLLPQIKDIKAQCILISFSKKVIASIKEKSDFKTGYVLPKYSEKYKDIAKKLKPNLLICNYRKLPAPDADGILPDEALWSGPWQWTLYEIDDPELALLYSKNGVRFIETNQIGTMLQHPSLQAAAASATEDRE